MLWIVVLVQRSWIFRFLTVVGSNQYKEAERSIQSKKETEFFRAPVLEQKLEENLFWEDGRT